MSKIRNFLFSSDFKSLSIAKGFSVKLSKLKFKWSVFLMMFIAVFSLSACASNSLTANCYDNKIFYQWFSFDMSENPEIELRDYFYGTENCPALYNPPYLKERGECLQIHGEFGPNRRAEKLYVRWRIKSTGQEYEDTVDLRNRLPKDMTNQRIHFSVKSSQLYVYLVTPERRLPDMPVNGPKEFQLLKTFIVYPNID